MSTDQTQLLQILVERFGLEDLRTLCFYLDIDFDSLGGEGKDGKARELVLHMKRRGQLDRLATEIKELRPDVQEAHPALPRKKTATGTPQVLHIDTGGGAVVLGDVTTTGGDFVGRDRSTNLPESWELSGRSGGSERSNPFGTTGRITDTARFFDREELLRQIFEELVKGANLSLVGASQVGKSSLLSMVCALGPERMGMEPETFAYLSLEWVDDEEDFYDALCDKLSIETCRGYKLTRALRGKRRVLCLDEIEKMGWDGFTVHVRSRLRGLADGPAASLRLVIASRSALASLFPDSAELTSPLAGICHQLDVGPFRPDVARVFLAQRLRTTGVTFTESEIGVLLAETGGHPAKLQRAAADLYRSHTTHNTQHIRR